MIRRFTGWHMLAWMVGMFGVVIGVNVVMARQAIATFGGTVVDNSYVASQRYNDWLAAAERQRGLGWEVEVRADDARRIELDLRSRGGALDGAKIEASAAHPLGRTPERRIPFEASGAGHYRARTALPQGRWLLRLHVSYGDAQARFAREVAL